MFHRGRIGEGKQVQTQRDDFDVVKQFLYDVAEGRTALQRVHDIKTEVFAVAARMDRVRKMFPGTDLGLGEEVENLVKVLRRGRGLFSQAAAL